MLQLEWVKSESGEWLELDSATAAAKARGWGVYVIWTPNGQPQRPGTVLKVGSGNIPVRLYLERLNPELRWIGNVPLLVTWATVDQSHQPGVVRYLSDRLSPYFREFSEQKPGVPVNLPLTA